MPRKQALRVVALVGVPLACLMAVPFVASLLGVDWSGPEGFGGTAAQAADGDTPKPAAPAERLRRAAGAGGGNPKMAPTRSDRAAVAPGGAAAQPEAERLPVSVQHAINAKVGRCTPLIRRAVAFTNALPEVGAMSVWSKEQPDEHMFQSILGLKYDSAVAPMAAAVVVASPDKTGCQATLVQVHPTSRSCGEIEGDFRKGGQTLASLSGLPITQVSDAPRQMLLPTPNGGCVVVGIALETQ